SPYLANPRALRPATKPIHVACILRGADEILPATGNGYEQGGLASLLRDWAGEAPFCNLPFASLLIADNLNDLHPSVALNPRAARIQVPLPPTATLGAALTLLRRDLPPAFEGSSAEDAGTAATLTGVAVTAGEALCKRRAHQRQPIRSADLVEIKKQLVERESGGLIDFIESRRTLADYEGQQALKTWLQQDVKLW